MALIALCGPGMGACFSVEVAAAPGASTHREAHLSPLWTPPSDGGADPGGDPSSSLGLFPEADLAEFVRRAAVETTQQHAAGSGGPAQLLDVFGVTARAEALRPLAATDARVLPMPRCAWARGIEEGGWSGWLG